VPARAVSASAANRPSTPARACGANPGLIWHRWPSAWTLSETLAWVEAVIVVSEHMRRSLFDNEPAVGHRLYRPSRPIRQPTRPPRRSRQRAEEPTVIVCVGRITVEKAPQPAAPSGDRFVACGLSLAEVAQCRSERHAILTP
jgi:hypothetical protein